MKKGFGIAAFVLLSAIQAHGQTANKGPAVGGGATASSASGGGGGIGGGGATSSGSRLPSYPRAQFAMSAVSGGDPSYAPSTFLAFDQAVAEGTAKVETEHKSLGQVAAENGAAFKAKAKFAFTQDDRGNVIPAPKQ
jgi:hypothetical protein